MIKLAPILFLLLGGAVVAGCDPGPDDGAGAPDPAGTEGQTKALDGDKPKGVGFRMCVQKCTAQGTNAGVCNQRCGAFTGPVCKPTPEEITDAKVNHALCILGADEWEKGCDATIVGAITKFCEHVADNIRAECPPADPCGQ
jgi:hypothetical protein